MTQFISLWLHFQLIGLVLLGAAFPLALAIAGLINAYKEDDWS